MTTEELHLFDFDGTLFRSPDPPEGYEGSWGQEAAGLNEPLVPRRPGPEWWLSASVLAAQKAHDDPKVYSVLWTGRGQETFGHRVRELLGQKNLHFDEAHCNPGMDTGAWKRQLLQELLQQGAYQTVRLWDDRADLLESYTQIIEATGAEAVTHRTKPPKTPAIERVARHWLAAKGLCAMVDEALMDRAAQLLWYMTEQEAVKHLVGEGITRSDAFLAVKAGKLLNRRRSKGPRQRVARGWIRRATS